MRMKKLGSLLFLIVPVLLIYSIVNRPAVQEQVATFARKDFVPENIYTDLDSIAGQLDQEIRKGTDEWTIYIKDFPVEELGNVNTSLDGVFGYATQYQQVGNVGDAYQKITIKIEHTINYQAMDA